MSIEIGFCQCGCGQKTKIPTRNCASKGWVKGIPMRFVRGHYNKFYGIPESQKKFLSETRFGRNNPNWKTGGISFDKHQGRWIIRCRDGSKDPFAWAIIFDKYGRFPTKHEIAHHKDFIKTNDTHENLILISDVKHNRLHALANPIPKTKESCRYGGLKGGATTVKRYGVEHFKEMSRISAERRRVK